MANAEEKEKKSVRLSSNLKFTKWTIKDVSNWLESIDLKMYAPTFAECSIDGELLQSLTEEVFSHKL